MFIVILKFSKNKSRARELMNGHNQWIQHGFEDGVLLLAGSVEPKLGGAVIAHNTSLTALQNRLKDDPFVAEEVVTVEIIEITPAKTDQRFEFLIES